MGTNVNMLKSYHHLHDYNICRSGSAANLEIALQIIKNALEPFNKVIFAFWGAEELGLLGSTYFVNQLSEEQRKDIALNLNFDMIVSRCVLESAL